MVLRFGDFESKIRRLWEQGSEILGARFGDFGSKGSETLGARFVDFGSKVWRFGSKVRRFWNFVRRLLEQGSEFGIRFGDLGSKVLRKFTSSCRGS